ncbi:MAG: DUF4858 domain-containing protein [Tannerellaceae bacterium]|nr:DUF4858 domain-containing protein [Tannerellaceae bacterium]
MKRRYIVFICLCLAKTGSLSAQWTEKDSIWLKNVLDGKEEIRLHPEVLEAIRDGNLIHTDRIEVKDQLQEAPAHLPVSQDFSEFIRPRNTEKPVDPLTLPPAVFMRYGLNIPLPAVYKAFMVPQEIRRNGTRPSGISFNDGLKQLFSPKERARARMRRNANAWKNYNSFP